MSHSDLEAMLEHQGRELMRQLLQAHLDLRAQATPTGPVVGADGVARTHTRQGERALETLLGTVQVTRAGRGARGRETLFPLDAALNLPTERYSFGIRRRAAEEATKGAFAEAVAVLTRHSSAAVAKRQIEAVVRRAAVDFTDFYLARRLAWPGETNAASNVLVLRFDGKRVPMRHDALRPATQAAAARRVRKLATRLTKGEKRHQKRMAQVPPSTRSRRSCSAEDIIRDLRPADTPAPVRPRPEGKRVWASLATAPAIPTGRSAGWCSSRERRSVGAGAGGAEAICGCGRCGPAATGRLTGGTMSTRSRRTHATQYAHGQMPTLTPSVSPARRKGTAPNARHLRVIK